MLGVFDGFLVAMVTGYLTIINESFFLTMLIFQMIPYYCH